MKSLDHVVLALKGAGFWLFSNTLGIGAYFAVECWILAPLRAGENSDQGDPVRDWLGELLPLLALYLGINLTWLVMSRKNGVLGIERLSIWLLVCLAWVIVLASDPLNLRGFLEMLNGTAWPP